MNTMSYKKLCNLYSKARSLQSLMMVAACSPGADRMDVQQDIMQEIVSEIYELMEENSPRVETLPLTYREGTE